MMRLHDMSRLERWYNFVWSSVWVAIFFKHPTFWLPTQKVKTQKLQLLDFLVNTRME